MHVALSSGTAFVADKLWENREVKGEFSDAQGWLNANGATLQCGDINGDKRVDFIFRGNAGIRGAFAP